MSTKQYSNNKRIAKNTLLLYTRMFLTMAVGLYTSRVILQALGISDYGIYNVVGGFVSMLAYLNSVFVAATQRFLSYSIGLNDKKHLHNVFCTSVSVHIILAVIILVVAETFGIWFVNNKLNIDPSRIIAANWVFQCSLATLMINILNIPYNASLVAHEHMNVYAYMSIFDVFAKLGVVYLLYLTSADKLILYSVSLIFVTLVTFMVYLIYCRRNFSECRYSIKIEPSLFKEMSTYAGWTAVGGLGFVVKDQCINIILNLFFGTTINAARGVAGHVNGVVNQFANNFMMAVSPQITKQYASGNIESSRNLVHASSKFSYFLMSLIIIPIIINLKYILSLWLVDVPDYTYEFLIIILIGSHIASMATPIATAINSTGKIKKFQIGVSLIFFVELPLAYLALKLGYKPYYALLFCLITQVIALFYRYFVLSKQVEGYSIKFFVFNNVLKSFIVFVCSLGLSMFIYTFFEPTFVTLLVTTAISMAITLIAIYILGLSRTERNIIYSYLSGVLKNIRK